MSTAFAMLDCEANEAKFTGVSCRGKHVRERYQDPITISIKWVH